MRCGIARIGMASSFQLFLVSKMTFFFSSVLLYARIPNIWKIYSPFLSPTNGAEDSITPTDLRIEKLIGFPIRRSRRQRETNPKQKE